MSETYTPEQIEAVARRLTPSQRRSLRWLTYPVTGELPHLSCLKALEKVGLLDHVLVPTTRGKAVAAYLREKEQTR